MQDQERTNTDKEDVFERQLREAFGLPEKVNETKKETQIDKGKISDGYHTFDELYFHRTVLFACLCKSHQDNAFKSKKHSDGTMFDGMFIAGIKTPMGYYTYHCEMEYWDFFPTIAELDYAPEWDGHKPEDVGRLLSLI